MTILIVDHLQEFLPLREKLAEEHTLVYPTQNCEQADIVIFLSLDATKLDALQILLDQIPGCVRLAHAPLQQKILVRFGYPERSPATPRRPLVDVMLHPGFGR